MKLNLFFLGLAAADEAAPSVYSPKVGCDVTNNKFRVELPAWKREFNFKLNTEMVNGSK